MELNFNFVVDRCIRGRIYPALAQHQAEPYTQSWREFEQHWPNTVPLRLQEYCEKHSVGITVFSPTDSYPKNSFYPIGLGWFNFDLDYISLLPTLVLQAVQQSQLKILFYYHEGDNPNNIKQRLDSLGNKWSLPCGYYRFISGNTAAHNVKNFVYFNDFELWYRHRNQTPPKEINKQKRLRDFVALNRIHKSWRATFMADLEPLLDNSIWSYCQTGSVLDEENPLEIDCIDDLRSKTQSFLNRMPRFADALSDADRNNHSITVDSFFTDSWMHIVIETHFDADQSRGAFLTEKTFKPIKHAQPFFIAGCTGSLQCLREMGYKTFDHVLDNSYDSEPDNTRRWRMLKASIVQAKSNLEEIFDACLPDIKHNQQLFLATKQNRLSKLLKQLYE
jgi:hypothetical protein